MGGAVRWLACITLIACAAAPAQTFDATKIGTPANLSTATWHFALGDDPRWSDPAFDDSHWNTFTPRRTFRSQGYAVPSRIWWSRVHVHVVPGTRNLAVRVLDASYQIYINGRLVGQQGGFPDDPRMTYFNEEVYPIPVDAIPGDSVVIAVREWLLPELSQYDYAPLGDVLLGDQSLLRDHRSLQHDSLVLSNAGGAAEGLIAFIVGIWSLALFRTQPEHREYLWLAVIGLIDASASWIAAALRLSQPPIWVGLSTQALVVLYTIAFVLFVCAFLSVRVNWLVRAYCIALFWMPINSIGLYQGWIPHRYYIVGVVIVSSPVDLLAPLLAIRQYSRGDREAGALLLPLLLLATSDYAYLLFDLLHLKQGWIGGSLIPNLDLGPASFSPAAISSMLFYLTIGGIMLRRSMDITRQQQRTAAELEEGRSVQAFLLGRDASAPGFKVESAYLPAREVGGDFFQTIAGADGSLLAVIGDVAGKGLQAAMRVSMLIGAVRLSPEDGPAALLGKLNGVLLQDGSSGFTTCLAARLNIDGSATIANAGHLPPYLNGRVHGCLGQRCLLRPAADAGTGVRQRLHL